MDFFLQENLELCLSIAFPLNTTIIFNSYLPDKAKNTELSISMGNY